MTDTCATCRFYHLSTDGGMCRRNPPQGTIVQWVPHFSQATGPTQIPVTTAFYPPVRPEMWCGEYRRAASGLVAVVATDQGEEAGQGVVVLRPEPVGPHAGGGGED